MAEKFHIQFADQWSRWHHLQVKYNLPDAVRVAQSRASSTGKRHRVIDDDGHLLDLMYP